MALLDSPGGRLKLARMNKGWSGVEFLRLLEQRVGKEATPSPGHLTHIEK